MFSGLMPAMVTPFDEQGEVDLRATEAVVESFIEAGVSGISPLGSTGEFSHLTFDERKRFAEEVIRIVSGRVPLVVGVGAAGTREAVELARHAEGVGVDAVLAVSPFYWKVGEEGLFRHFATVAGSVGIPVLIYNLPMLTGIDLSPSLIARIAAACPNASGLKDTVTEYHHTVSVLREVKRVRPDFSVLAGSDKAMISLSAASRFGVGSCSCLKWTNQAATAQGHHRNCSDKPPREFWELRGLGFAGRQELQERRGTKTESSAL